MREQIKGARNANMRKRNTPHKIKVLSDIVRERKVKRSTSREETIIRRGTFQHSMQRRKTKIPQIKTKPKYK